MKYRVTQETFERRNGQTAWSLQSVVDNVMDEDRMFELIPPDGTEGSKTVRTVGGFKNTLTSTDNLTKTVTYVKYLNQNLRT